MFNKLSSKSKVVEAPKLGVTRYPIALVASSVHTWDVDTMPIWWAYKRTQPTRERRKCDE